MNVGTFNDSPPDNTVPSWLLPCTCTNPKCQCLARLKPDILCVRGINYFAAPPATQTQTFPYNTLNSPTVMIDSPLRHMLPNSLNMNLYHYHTSQRLESGSHLNHYGRSPSFNTHLLYQSPSSDL
jgi:hypothetical protein